MMTVHSAKGLEFPVVFLAGMEEGVFPGSQTIGASDEEMEEEPASCLCGHHACAERAVYPLLPKPHGVRQNRISHGIAVCKGDSRRNLSL